MEPEPRRISRLAVAGGVTTTLIAAGAIWLWIERTPIATGYIDEALRAKGVPASYRLTQVGFRTQRIEAIRIGDPAHPDLVADWAEIRLSVGIGGVSVRAVDAGGVRLHGRVAGGGLSLGAIDRLLPAGDGKAPFALPDIALTARAAKIDLDTPAGTVHATVDGKGGLADGFRGKVGIVADRLAVGGCGLDAPRAQLAVEIAEGRPLLDGPVGAQLLSCSGMTVRAPAIDLSARGSGDLVRWTGVAVVQRGALAVGAVSAARLGGRIGFDASPKTISGEGTFFAERVRTVQASAARLGIEGGYRFDPQGQGSFVGEASVRGAAVDPRLADRALESLRNAEATPVGPVLTAWGKALRAAGRRIDGTATLSVRVQPGGAALQVERLDMASASGARLLVRSERAEGLGWRWPQSLPSINASAELSGGGLPEARVSLRQPVPGAPLTGSATVATVRVGDARLAIAPTRFGPAARGGTMVATRLTMDGPLADGRVEGLDLPLSVLIGRGGAIAVNRNCAPLGFTRLAVAGSVIDRSSLPLCPIDGAMFGRTASGTLYGGARIAGPRLRGRVGEQPLTMQAQTIDVRVGRPGFDLSALQVRLGDRAAPTRLDVAHLAGTVDRVGIAGSFAAADGKIGPVPILLSQGAGQWSLAGGVLTIDGAVKVDDAQTDAPRYRQLSVPDLKLVLNGGYITAGGTLTEPLTGKRVSSVRIAHSLPSGRGDATLDVRGLRFAKGFQPDRLTPLTVGIVANVEGELAGQGKIVWAGGNVTSSGVFRTEGLNLAAAFGPVTGLKGEIRFTDLLALETAPHQTATVAEINPGIAVVDGVIHYRLLSGQKLVVEDGKWPLAGGTLTLEPTTMDFGQPVERRMLFRIDGLDAAAFVQQLEFKNIAVTGKFDGVLPIIFDAQGGRIEGGQLRVRPGGGTLSYVGDVTNADLGRMARIAFDALKAMRYDRLTIDLNGSLDGEIVSKVRFDGTNNAPKQEKQANGLVGRLLAPITRLPFRFNITITAPFRGLVSSAQTFVDPSIVLRNVPVQPQAPAPANPAPDPVRPPTPPAAIQPR
jgi:translocation and assembly module TamB